MKTERPTLCTICVLCAAVAVLAGCHRPAEHAQGGDGTAGQDFTYGLNQTSITSIGEFRFDSPPLTEIGELLASPNPESFSDRTVHFRGVEIQRVFSRHYMLIGSDSDRVVLVRFDVNRPALSPGDTVDVRGFVMQLGQDLNQWDLTDADRAMLKGHTIFINATNVRNTGGGQ